MRESDLDLFLTEHRLKVIIMTGDEALEYAADLISEGLLISSPDLIVAEVSKPGAEGSGWGTNYKSFVGATLAAANAYNESES